MSKYKSKKITYDGITFDSKKECSRYKELKALEKAGIITDLALQVKFVLIPEQREYTNEIYKKGPKKGCFKKGKILERECSYYADFVYWTLEGLRVVEDTKGMRTADYKIKRKLMLYMHGVKIREV